MKSFIIFKGLSLKQTKIFFFRRWEFDFKKNSLDFVADESQLFLILLWWKKSRSRFLPGYFGILQNVSNNAGTRRWSFEQSLLGSKPNT